MKRSYLKRKTPSKTSKKVRRNALRAKPKSKSVSHLKQALDRVFSLFIRNRDNGICFTCNVQKPIAQMQNGHYISRSHNNTRYDEQNCHCQCVGCNVFKHGNMDVYALKLQEKYGPDILKTLNDRKNVIRQFTAPELQALIDRYETAIT